MLADRPGSGIEQPVDRVLFVLLLLVHHRAVLPTGIAVGSCGATPSQYLGMWPLVVRKVCPAALALAGRVAVVQSVHQVKDVEV